MAVVSELNNEAGGGKGGIFESVAIPFLKDIGVGYQ